MPIRIARLRKYGLVLAGLVGTALLARSIPRQPEVGKGELTGPARVARDNLRQLLRALAIYREEHAGTFPHDDRGPDYALYSLRPHLDARFLTFRPIADAKEAPFWDDNEKCARNADWEYLNVSDPWAIEPNEIIIASRPHEFPSTVFFAVRIGAIRNRQASSAASSKAFVGSYMTDESFFVASKNVFEEWERLGPQGLGWSTTSSGRRAIRTTHPTRKVVYEYDYAEGVLSARRIQCNGIEIHEQILLDDFGRISAINRSPDDWQDVWTKCNEEANQ
jgi:hypothetical protein